MPPSLRPSRAVSTQVALGDLALSPDGSLAAFTRRTVERGAYRTRLFLAPTGGGRPRRLTCGDVDDSAPAFSPHGDRIAFLRGEQVWAIAVDGGEAEQVTRASHGVDAFRFSPDGRTLLLLAAGDETRFAVGPLTAGRPPLARRMTRVDWRLDRTGHVDRHAHLWLVAARPGARPRRLTGGDWSAASPGWSPDGAEVCFVADMGPDADLRSHHGVYAVAVGGGEPRLVCELPGDVLDAAWSPDGRWIAFRGIEPAGVPEDGRRSLYVAPSAGGEARDLAPGHELWPLSETYSDLDDWRLSENAVATWCGSDALLCPVTERGLARLWRFPLEGAPEPVGDDDGAAYMRHAGSAAGQVVLEARVLAPPRLRAGGRTLARAAGGGWAAALARLETIQADVPGPGGDVRTWLLRRRDLAGAPLPAVLSLHGGPTGSWGPVPWLPDLVLADHGYLVVRPDPRGSCSYGAAWLGALIGDWGGPDAADCLAALDWAVGERLADAGRLGVTGLSYGGFLTQWLVTQTDRFRAAVAVNGVANQVSTYGNCDLAVPWSESLGLGIVPRDAEALWRQSPLAYADRVTTPLLILQGEADLRCPPADNEQLFVALRTLRREVEYVLYPEESHVMQTTGRPDRRVDMLERMLAWLAAHGLAPGDV